MFDLGNMKEKLEYECFPTNSNNNEHFVDHKQANENQSKTSRKPRVFVLPGNFPRQAPHAG